MPAAIASGATAGRQTTAAGRSPSGSPHVAPNTATTTPISRVFKTNSQDVYGRVSHMLPSRAFVHSGSEPRRSRHVISDLHDCYGHNPTTTEVMLRGPDTPTFAEHFRYAVRITVHGEPAAR